MIFPNPHVGPGVSFVRLFEIRPGILLGPGKFFQFRIGLEIGEMARGRCDRFCGLTASEQHEEKQRQKDIKSVWETAVF